MKVVPDTQDFETLSDEMSRPCLIPLVTFEEICRDPSKVYLDLRQRYDVSYLLESLTGPRAESRYSVIGCDPLLYLRIREGKNELEGRPEVVRASRRRIDELGGEVDELRILKNAMFFNEMRILGLGFPRYVLGATGYLSYDFVRSTIGLDSGSKDDLSHPTSEFVLPGLVMVFDHVKERTYYASLMLLTDETDFGKVHSESVEKLENFLGAEIGNNGDSKEKIHSEFNMGREDFERSVEKVKGYIRSGDVIQTVISRRIDLKPAPSLGNFYTRLREINPSPYMFFLDFPEESVVGSSPEALVRVKDNEVMTRPIAGTRRRGKSEEDDKVMEKELLQDDKERAEHVMLVDLGRNDIGKVSKYGTVETSQYMEVEKYGHVQHIVSQVEGELKDNLDSFDALRAVFPAGTVTGAPKVRAMEIIEELEPTRRGIYSGAVGTFSYTGDADFAITIRTLTASGDEAQVQVGAGIVADSIPSEEYYETENKAKSLLKAAGVSE